MSKQEIGVVGLAVMGKNLALNVESRGYSVALFNRTKQKIDDMLSEFPSKKFHAAYSVKDFVATLEKPRKIFLMVKAGEATDQMINELTPYLEKGDILIDGGNSFYQDTIRRNEALCSLGVNYLGVGVSGGEEGALKGPSLMPGGQKEAYNLVEPFLRKIAAITDDGTPCVAYIGPDGAGHFVKMVHNGIEYGDMQLIAESYDLMKRVLGLSASEISKVFCDWNKGELNSYLIEITADILSKIDDLGTGKPIVDVIKDSAANKGTGKWTSQNALDLGVSLPLITESVYARYISSYKAERVKASELFDHPNGEPIGFDETLIEKIREALYFSKIISYTQGFVQMRVASEKYSWDLSSRDISRVWGAGCIIRAQFLKKITAAYDKESNLENLLLDEYFLEVIQKYENSTREVVNLAIRMGVAVPALSSAISYFDSYRSVQLPANLIQAQRDYFGAHTYERVDREGSFHYEWND